MAIIINSDSSLSKFIGDLRELYRTKRYLRIVVKHGQARSGQQNKHTHVWYEQVAQELRENTAGEVKGFCKLHFGVPILRAEDADFREAYDKKILSNFTYEQKLIIMEDCNFPVTSRMSKDQLHRYEKKMQDHYRPLGVELKYIEKEAA